jgi:hypothetical protein
MQTQISNITSAVREIYPEITQRPVYMTVEQFSERNPAFTPSSLRNLIFKANERQASKGVIAGNGLLEAGAIIRIGRKVLINESKFYAWVESQNGAA